MLRKDVVAEICRSLGFSALLLLLLAAPGNSYGDTDNGEAETPSSPISVPNPGTDLWRAVRGRVQGAPSSYLEVPPPNLIAPQAAPAGVTQAGGLEGGVLINPVGNQWMKIRMQRMMPAAGWLLGGVLAVVVLFFMVRGRLQVEGGLSGKMVHRFGAYERALHWFLAIVFLFLAVTGLTLLFGRALLKPLLGAEGLGLIASAAKEGHNLFGPLFMLAVLLMLVRFLRENIYAKGDLTWLLRGGGMLSKKHVTGGFFNMGEKTWYWLVMLVGLAISVTGFLLLFPNFGQSRQLMGLSHLVHMIGAIVLIAVAIGHMYLGSIGSEGTLEGMKSGYVDFRWAASHHDRWAKECEEEGAIISPEEFAVQHRGGAPVTAERQAGGENA